MNSPLPIGKKDDGKTWLTSCIATIALAKHDRLTVLTDQAAEAAKIVHFALLDRRTVIDKINEIARTAGYVEEFGTDAVQAALSPFGDEQPQTTDGTRRIFFRRTSTNVIMATKYPPLREVVPGYLFEGFTVLAGRQKLGKTWLAIDWAIAVATGGVAMGSIDCTAGDVLYIDMENGPRRIQGRINALFPDERARPDLSRLEWVTEALQLDQGFLSEIERWRTSVPNPTMIVVDVLQRIKPAGIAARNAYENDYGIWAPLQQWATEKRIAVLGLHHTKKGGADDPLEALSGSNGLSACADTTVVLDSDQNGKTLYVRGRDVEEKETAVIFAGGSWTVLGNAVDVRRSDERSVIVAAISDHGEPMTPLEIADATGQPRANVRQLLRKMAKSEELYKIGKCYWGSPLYPGNSDHSGHSRGEE